eukprot:2141902-Amphidinium_carterae.1
MAGGASDSAIRQKLAKKATQAGILHANDLLQLIWGENSSELRQLWGTPPQVRAKLLIMAKNSDHVLDPGKFFTADSVFDNDPWGKFTGSKAADPLANSSTSSSSKASSKPISCTMSFARIMKTMASRPLLLVASIPETDSSVTRRVCWTPPIVNMLVSIIMLNLFLIPPFIELTFAPLLLKLGPL